MRKLVFVVVLGTLGFIGRMAVMDDGGAGAMAMLSEFTGGAGFSTSSSTAAGGAKFVAISKDAPKPVEAEPSFMEKYVWSNEKIVAVLAQVGLERPGATREQIAADLAMQAAVQPAGQPQGEAAMAAMAARLEAVLVGEEASGAVPANLLPAANPGAKFVSSR
ncbi:MAG: hypothetical protein ACRBCL_12575 [Maritimibacter sp.]